MKKYLIFLLCILLLLSNLATPSVSAEFISEPTVKTENTTDDFPYAPDRVIVKLKTVKTNSIAPTTAYSTDSFLFSDLGIETADVRLINPSNTSNIVTKNTVLCATQNDTQNNMFVVTLKNSGIENVQSTLKVLRSNPNVEYAVPDRIIKVCNTTPNDEKYTSEAYEALDAIRATQAWDITTGSKKVVVGIIDTGIDGKHEDLKDNLWVNPKPNRNGYRNDLHGYDFANRCGGTPTDDDGHGTHVAGIVGANGDNGIGVCGVNWNVQLAWLRIGDKDGNIAISHAVEAINYAKNHDIPILNASWSGYASFNDYSDYKPLEEAIKNYDGLFVTAAGNDDVCIDTCPCYPASFDLPNIITVGASHSDGYNSDLTNGLKAGYSNYGTGVDLVAPGDNILSTIPGNNYAEMSGTSMAVPMVAGVAALVMAKYPQYSTAQIKNAILNGTVKNGMFLKYCIANGAALNAYGALLKTKPVPEKINICPTRSITAEAGQTMLLYANLSPSEANQDVVWTSDNTDVVKMNADGSYVAVSPGTARITATSVENPSLSQSIPITVTPAVSTVVNFKDENFKLAYLYSINQSSSLYENGIRYMKSKVYLSETHSETQLQFRGTDIQSLSDLKYFPNLESIWLVGNALTGTVDLTGLKKLKRLSIDSIIFNGYREYSYAKDTYAYNLKGVKAIIGGQPVEAHLTGSGFMEIDWTNWNGNVDGSIEVFYEDYHRPAHATINGENLYPHDRSVSMFFFKCNRPNLINIEVQPKVNISDPHTFQTIAEQLKKTDPLSYRFYNWIKGYKLTELDVIEFSRYKPLCKYDLEKIGLSNLSINSKRYNISKNSISKISAGTTVTQLLNGLNNSSNVKVYDGNKERTGTYKVGTGMTVKLMIGRTALQTLSVVVTGDINGDGGISITDMLAIKSDLLKKSKLSGAAAKAADTNGDNGVSITDFIQIKSHILGKSKIQAR